MDFTLSGGILLVLGWIITVHDESIKFLGLLKEFGSSFITGKFLFVLRISIVEMDLNIDESQVAKSQSFMVNWSWLTC